jgi:hypothetical protein
VSRIFRIIINWDALQANLSRELRQAQSREDMSNWLKAAGFKLDEDGEHWLVPEADLGHLDPSEVSSAEVVEDH